MLRSIMMILVENRMPRAQGITPSPLLHLSGHLLYAEILINYLQGVMHGLGQGGQQQQQRHRPASKDRDEISGLLGDLGARVLGALGKGLPPPLVPGNWESEGSRCFMNRDIQVR